MMAPSLSFGLRHRFVDSRGGRFRAPSVTSCFIGQALALHPDKGAVSAHLVVNDKFDTVGVTEVKFGKVATKVGF